jgi:hypothetical protein
LLAVESLSIGAREGFSKGLLEAERRDASSVVEWPGECEMSLFSDECIVGSE